MAISYAIAQHGVAFPSKCLATNGGAHIFNIHVTEDVDNGWFVGKGAWESIDLYTEAAPTSLSGKIQAKAANGNYYVEITAVENAYFVYTVPMIEEEWTNNFKKESNFYNKSGAVVRAYEVKVGDIIELSASAFKATPSAANGTVTATLQAISGKTAMQLGE